MTDPFEYDVFLSFSSADEEIVKPIWQELCSNGLRVFWSDSTLKKEVGNSWFDIIEKSLERSRHMILFCSSNSMNSKWVKREYRAFFDYCYSPGTRRLIPLLAHGFTATDLPIFLRELQIGKSNDPAFIQQIIPLLGGINIEKLLSENQTLREKMNLLSSENDELKREVENIRKSLTIGSVLLKEREDELALKREEISSLLQENNLLKDGAEKQRRELLSEYSSREALQSELTAAQQSLSSVLQENTSMAKQLKDLTNKLEAPQQGKELNKKVKTENELPEAKMAVPEAVLTVASEEIKPKWDVTNATLYVSNLPQFISENELRYLFKQAGNIKRLQLNRRPDGSTIIGFIEMSTEDEALKATGMFNSYLYDKTLLQVSTKPLSRNV